MVNAMLSVRDESGQLTQKIVAIKMVRNEAGLSLLDAKSIVDVLSGYRAVRPEEDSMMGMGYKPTSQFPAPNPVEKRLKEIQDQNERLATVVSTIVRAAKETKSLAEFKKRLSKV